MNAALAREWLVFRLAVQLLTRLPVGDPPWSEEAMQDTPRWYPGVGIVVGGLSALVFWLAWLVLPVTVAALLAVIAGIWATGAMHEDGLADCADAFGGHAPTERVLEIMRDSRIGTYGVLGLGLVVSAKVAALAAFSAPGMVAGALLAGHGLSRLAIVGVMGSAVYVRKDGAGVPVAGGDPGLALPAIVAGLGLLPLWAVAGVWPLALGLGAGLGGYWATRRLWLKRIGGYTGDCLGATQQICEICVYLGILVAL